MYNTIQILKLFVYDSKYYCDHVWHTGYRLTSHSQHVSMNEGATYATFYGANTDPEGEIWVIHKVMIRSKNTILPDFKLHSCGQSVLHD